MTEGLQGYMNFAVGDSPFTVPPACSFYGKPCARSFEARQTALIHLLIYIRAKLIRQLLLVTWIFAALLAHPYSS